MNEADGMNPPAVSWFIIVSSAAVCGDVVYLQRETNASVQIPCVASNKSMQLVSFTLTRGADGNSSEVLYHHIKSTPSFPDQANVHRFSVQNELRSYRANINITHLQEQDTDLYHCVFNYRVGNDYLEIPSGTKFFLHVVSDVFGDLVFDRRETNDSVQIPCACPDARMTLSAFSFMRGADGNSSELLHHSVPSSKDEANDHRLSVQSRSHRANITITSLQEDDTDLYHCVCHYSVDRSVLKVPGSTKFFLHVGNDPEECACHSYELLLYTLSALAGLLFLGVLTVAGAYCKTPPQRQRKPDVSPVYEEMRMMGKAGNIPAVNGS